MFDLNESAGLWSLFISAFISSTLLPGGSEVLLLYLATQTDQNPLALWFVASFGNTLGGVTSLLLGWWVASRFPGRSLEKNHKKALLRIRRFGSPVLLLSWAPVIGDPLCFVAGWLKMPWVRAIIFIAAGKAARYAAMLLFV